MKGYICGLTVSLVIIIFLITRSPTMTFNNKSHARYYLQQLQELLEEERTQRDHTPVVNELLLGFEKRVERMDDDLDTLESIIEDEDGHQEETAEESALPRQGKDEQGR